MGFVDVDTFRVDRLLAFERVGAWARGFVAHLGMGELGEVPAAIPLFSMSGLRWWSLVVTITLKSDVAGLSGQEMAAQKIGLSETTLPAAG